MASSYIDPNTLKVVTVAINYGTSSEAFSINVEGSANAAFDIFETSDAHNLASMGQVNAESAYTLPPRSITTFVQA